MATDTTDAAGNGEPKISFLWQILSFLNFISKNPTYDLFPFYTKIEDGHTKVCGEYNENRRKRF